MQCSEVRWRFVLTLQVDTVVCSAIPRQPEVLVSSGSAERRELRAAISDTGTQTIFEVGSVRMAYVPFEQEVKVI